MAGLMVPRSPLDDPQTAAHAWARYSGTGHDESVVNPQDNRDDDDD